LVQLNGNDFTFIEKIMMHDNIIVSRSLSDLGHIG
jgi:hypothetical protein